VIVLRGKHCGASGKVHQFCNDWITADLADGTPFTGSLLSVQLDPDEVAMFRAATDVGSMWREFDLSDEGRFTRKRRGRRPS
jgi:hypothetical protein